MSLLSSCVISLLAFSSGAKKSIVYLFSASRFSIEGAIRPGYLSLMFLLVTMMRCELMVWIDVRPISRICFMATAIKYITMLASFSRSQP